MPSPGERARAAGRGIVGGLMEIWSSATQGPTLRALARTATDCRVLRALAGWQSGHAADCKSVYAGSIPTSASIPLIQRHPRMSGGVCVSGQSARRQCPSRPIASEEVPPTRGDSGGIFSRRSDCSFVVCARPGVGERRAGTKIRCTPVHTGLEPARHHEGRADESPETRGVTDQRRARSTRVRRCQRTTLRII